MVFGNPGKVKRELGYEPMITFGGLCPMMMETGIRRDHSYIWF